MDPPSSKKDLLICLSGFAGKDLTILSGYITVRIRLKFAPIAKVSVQHKDDLYSETIFNDYIRRNVEHKTRRFWENTILNSRNYTYGLPQSKFSKTTFQMNSRNLKKNREKFSCTL